MVDRSVISVHAKPETSKRLSRLAKATRRSKSFLANEAIEQYLAAEEEFVAGVRRGIEQIDAGQSSTTDEILDRASQRLLGKTYKSHSS